jgi:hypothetical protein
MEHLIEEQRRRIERFYGIHKEYNDEILYEYQNLGNIRPMCSVCFDITNGKTQCGHFICSECLAKLHKQICPQCRVIITKFIKHQN